MRCFHNFIIFYSEKKLNYKIFIYFQVSEFCFKSKRKKMKIIRHEEEFFII